jgi:hypothetical protein
MATRYMKPCAIGSLPPGLSDVNTNLKVAEFLDHFSGGLTNSSYQRVLTHKKQ